MEAPPRKTCGTSAMYTKTARKSHQSVGREDAMTDQRTPNRTDDADARGEHDYGKARPRNEPAGGSMHRQPNSYVAGEHGTQQVTTPPCDAGPRPGNRDRHDRSRH